MPSMSVKAIDRERAAPRSREGRAALAKMTLRLFDHWGLSVQDQLTLLGLSENSRMTLSRYRRGEPLADSPDLLDRVANLLQIHRSLRILFPRNREDGAYRWMTVPNRAFGGRTPVETIREERFLGLLKVRQYLDFERGR
jgi:transcriptional regulator with XRE-family HTH domain